MQGGATMESSLALEERQRRRWPWIGREQSIKTPVSRYWMSAPGGLPRSAGILVLAAVASVSAAAGGCRSTRVSIEAIAPGTRIVHGGELPPSVTRAVAAFNAHDPKAMATSYAE